MKRHLAFMRQACLLCDRSSCGYKTGCIAVKGGRVVGEGYNQTLKGELFCQSGFCYREQRHLTGGAELEKVCSIHAEANLIALSAQKGVSLKGADLYVSTFPCLICARSIVQAGFKRVFYMSDYASNEAMPLLKANNIVVACLPEKDVWSS